MANVYTVEQSLHRFVIPKVIKFIVYGLYIYTVLYFFRKNLYRTWQGTEYRIEKYGMGDFRLYILVPVLRDIIILYNIIIDYNCYVVVGT